MSTFRGSQFWKMHSCGNTVVVFPRPLHPFSVEEVETLLSSGRGIAGDNLLCISTEGCPGGLDCVAEGYNTDGSRVGLSANGARSLTLLGVTEKLFTDEKESFEIFLDDIRINTEVIDAEKGEVAIVLPPPSFDPDMVPYGGSSSQGRISLMGVEYEYVVVDIGNPNLILFQGEGDSAEFSEINVRELGEMLNADSELFPERVNLSLCRMHGPGKVEARIFERGVGIVPSSGTAAIAVAAACRSFRGGDEDIEVVMIGGSEFVEWKGGGRPIRAINSVERICSGEVSSRFEICSTANGAFRSAA